MWALNYTTHDGSAVVLGHGRDELTEIAEGCIMPSFAPVAVVFKRVWLAAGLPKADRLFVNPSAHCTRSHATRSPRLPALAARVIGSSLPVASGDLTCVRKSIPQARSVRMIGSSVRPSAVRQYSTRGGTSG